eukprot:comp23427_c1_seq2/m.38990 comp23427_c1_seq2/g.38990  ORF comp23427_c1_seq2/g.38990 comp23427_c1_seq2/m.38990 type:complete len:119 (-) comp23427_c1_seq2:400-756(-)
MGYILITYSVAVIVEDLGTAFAVLGATDGILVCYVLPGILYMGSFRYSWGKSYRNHASTSVKVHSVGVGDCEKGGEGAVGGGEREERSTVERLRYVGAVMMVVVGMLYMPLGIYSAVA